MWTIESSPIGRIAVAPNHPVFCTTLDYDGKIRDDLVQVIHERFGIESVLSTCTQVHGVNVEHASAGEPSRSCDALWSGRRGVSIGIKIADCLPVTMVDPAHVNSTRFGAVPRRIVSEAWCGTRYTTPFVRSRPSANSPVAGNTPRT